MDPTTPEHPIEALYLDVDERGKSIEPRKDSEVPRINLDQIVIEGRSVQMPYQHARTLGWESLAGASTNFTSTINLSDRGNDQPADLRAVWKEVRRQVKDALNQRKQARKASK